MPMKQASAALKKVNQLADTPRANRIELAVALAELEDAKPGSVADLVKIRHRQRRALYGLFRVGRWLQQVDLPMSQCVSVGATKLEVLAKHCDNRPGKKPTRSEVTLAEKYTAAELPAILKVGPHVKTPVKGHCIMLRLTPSQYPIFEAALKKHGATKPEKGNGLVGKEAAIMAIIRKAQAAG